MKSGYLNLKEQKKILWEETDQVIWKDGILTIDLKNNKLMQLNAEKSFAKTFDSKAFNIWCERKKHHSAE